VRYFLAYIAFVVVALAILRWDRKKWGPM